MAYPSGPQEAQLTRPLLDRMAEGFALLDHDFRLLEINDEALRMEPRPRTEMIGADTLGALPRF